MTELTRRSLLTGTVATTAAAAVPLATSFPSRAAAPPAGTQAPGWYRYKVGSFEITVLTDGVNRFKGQGVFHTQTHQVADREKPPVVNLLVGGLPESEHVRLILNGARE